MVILAAEDLTSVPMFRADFLDEAGFKVLQTVGAGEALAVLAARPDVQATVMDIETPGFMNALVLAQVIRERWPGIGVIITSGRQHPRRKNLPEEVAFLAKPYLPETVINVIRQMAIPQVVEEPSSHEA